MAAILQLISSKISILIHEKTRIDTLILVQIYKPFTN